MTKMSSESMLLIGESGVGKTHYGAQLLKRLLNTNGHFRMNGAATNLEPFEATMECLNDGRSAAHTPTPTYIDSVWPIIDSNGNTFTLVWPDYGGEQIKTLLSTRRVPPAWRMRVTTASAWMLMLRLHQLRVSDDLLSKPLATLANGEAGEESADKLIQPSDQARMIELLQILLYLRGNGVGDAVNIPQLCLLLSCWDELGQPEPPQAMLRRQLPMLSDFITSNWESPIVLGLSALERPLDKIVPDEEYITRGPEQFGYIVLPDGTTTPDLTFPLAVLLECTEKNS
jgi:Double-GTPase 1